MTNQKITLTDLEKKVALVCIEETDGGNSASYDWLNPEDFGINKQSLKGVFGSLVKKGFMEYDGGDDTGEFNIYYWVVNVESDEHGRLINSIDGLISHLEHSNRDREDYKLWLEHQEEL